MESYGHIHFENEYSENNSPILSLEDSECDLGILFKKTLKFDEHVDKVVNTISGIIRSFYTY